MAAHNFDGSHASEGLADGYDLPLLAGPAQPLVQAPGGESMLDNPGLDGGDDRAPAPVPMHAFGWEGDGDPLFSLSPRQKG
jgi:hypothetical protein